MTINDKVIRIARNKYDLTILRHADFGSNHKGLYQTRRRTKPAKQPSDTVWQHITVTLDHGPTTGDFKRDVRTVESIGYNRFKSGISYNWIVDMKTGMIAEGMPLDAKGTHTVNRKGLDGFSYDQNYWGRAIAVLGMTNTPLSNAAAEAIARLIAAMIDAGALTQRPDYLPHSAAAAKDCPCDETRDTMPAIYKRAQWRRKNPPNSRAKRAYNASARKAWEAIQEIKKTGKDDRGIKWRLWRTIRRIQEKRDNL